LVHRAEQFVHVSVSGLLVAIDIEGLSPEWASWSLSTQCERNRSINS
jgi:hypothetical protein